MYVYIYIYVYIYVYIYMFNTASRVVNIYVNILPCVPFTLTSSAFFQHRLSLMFRCVNSCAAFVFRVTSYVSGLRFYFTVTFYVFASISFTFIFYV